ncbi:MAG: aminoacetone oxidase family FAD-binding enzyme, partial [Bacteroidales bacterium]|nr:aminoacetone oxidase family FAD-binding enzyme [Bacteroidales bacterium]
MTNGAPISEFIKHVYPNGRFLRSAFSSFFSKDIIELLNEHGVERTLERGVRYFPASNRSKDVSDALVEWVNSYKVDIRCGHRVEELIVEDNIIKGVKANGQKFLSNNVIIATGGKSYPATGSNGEGYELARNVGHSIERARPALVPLETEGDLAQKLQGLNLKNVKATVWVNGKKRADNFGEMIFTHFGLSGPIILTLSREFVRELQDKNRVEIAIDL